MHSDGKWRGCAGRAALIVALSVALVACGGGGAGGGSSGGTGDGGSSGGGSQPLAGDYLPLAVGNRWVTTDTAGLSRSVTRVVSTQSLSGGATGWVQRTQDDNGNYSEEVIEQTAGGVWSLASRTDDPISRALGRVQILRLPLVVGDRYDLFDRNLPNVADIDGDGRSDSVRAVARVTDIATESRPVVGAGVVVTARVTTEITQTFSLSSQAAPVVAVITVIDHYAPGIGPVASASEIRIAGDLVSTEREEVRAWRVGDRRSETVAPTITGQYPAPGESTQARGIGFTFSEPMDRAGVTAESFVLRGSSSPIAVEPRWINDTMLELVVAGGIPDGDWELSFDSTLQDLAANAVSGTRRWSFRVDTRGPTLVSTSPAQGATGVARDAVVRLAFDEPLQPNIADTVRVGVDASPGLTTATQVSLEGDRTLVVRAPGGWPQGEQVTLSVTAVLDGLRNEAGARLDFRVDPGRFDFARTLSDLPAAPLVTTLADTDGNGRAEVYLVVPIAPFWQALARKELAADGSEGALQRLHDLADGCTTTGLEASDLDNDGRLDLLVSSSSGFTESCGLHWLRGLGGGAFAPPQELHRGNGGAPVLLPDAAHGRPMIVMPLDSARLLVLRQGAVPGTWAAPQYLDTTGHAGNGPWNREIRRGDINGDGLQDLLVFTPEGDRLAGSGTAIRVLLQAPGGGVGSWTLLPIPAQFGAGGLLLDVNGDGRADLLFQNADSQAPWLAPARADGTLGPSAPWSDNTPVGASPLLHDLDGDGRPDLLYYTEALLYRLQRADGTFAAPAQVANARSIIQPATSDMRVADLDGDGRADLFIAGDWYRQRDRGPAGSAGPTSAGALRPWVARGGAADVASGKLATARASHRSRFGSALVGPKGPAPRDGAVR